MKRYRIGDFAKQMGVSVDFIKYYEENGLITSFQDPQNHYHYYDFSQSQCVMQIQYLRSLGYGVKEISALLKTADRVQAAALFAKKGREHEDSQRRCRYAAGQLEYYGKALECSASGRWYIVQTPAFYFLPHTNDEEYIRAEAVTGRIAEWNRHAPFVYGLDRWFFDASRSCGAVFGPMQHGRAVEAAVAEELGLKTDSPACRFPSQRCLEYYLEYAHAPSFNASPSLTIHKFDAALAVIEEKGFQIAGDMFVRFLSIFQEQGKEKELDVLYIPIA